MGRLGRAASAVFCWIVVPVGGCGDDTGPTVVPWAEIGTGTVEFEPIAPETEMMLIAGPQGGHHFIAHARMGGLLPGDPTMPGQDGNPTTRFTVQAEDGRRLDLAMVPYRLGYEASDSGDDPGQLGGDDPAYALRSGRIVQVLETEVAAMVGARVRIHLVITDADRASAEDQRWVRVVAADP